MPFFILNKRIYFNTGREYIFNERMSSNATYAVVTNFRCCTVLFRVVLLVHPLLSMTKTRCNSAERALKQR